MAQKAKTKKSKKVQVKAKKSTRSPRPKRVVAAKKAISRHYYSFMPEKKRHRVIVWVAFLLVAAIISAQMLYPLNRAVPLARMGEKWVGWQTDTEIANDVTVAFQRAKIVFEVGGDESVEYTLSETGAEPLGDSVARELTNYPFWQRFVPFSIFWQIPHVENLRVEFAEAQLDDFAQKVSLELSREPVNAKLAIEDGRLVAANDSSGYTVSAESLKAALREQKYSFAEVNVVKITTKIQPAAKQSASFAQVRARAEQALARPLTIAANDKTFVIEQAERASWLQLGEDENGATILKINEQNLHESIGKWSDAAGIKPGQTNITIENGREIGRTTGEKGTKIDEAALIPAIENYLLNGVGQSVLAANMIEAEPSVIYNNRYTTSEEGLRAYVRDKAKNGAWFSIKQLGGNGWSADADSGESVVSASTYKLFVAKRVFDEMDKGAIRWNDAMLDTTVSGCFDRMTIASTNPCAVAWLDKFGRQNMNNYVHGLGFSEAVTFVHPQATHVSAADLTKFMIGLERGTLISGAHRDRLLYSLSHHPYRYGIPAGSQAQEVYDKVGFLWDYIHDTAIVRHPRGTYVMTILTQGKSYAAIAAMTREIERIMYP